MGEDIKDLKRKFAGYWLAIRVTRRGKYKEPLSGELMAKAKTHHELHRVLTNHNVYETFAGKTPTKAVLL